MEKEKKTLKNYSKEFKLSAIKQVIEEGKGLRETAREYQVYTIHLNSSKKSRSRPQKNHGEIPTLIT